jgi:multisubunit Na+/H+ antiporter MnhF subunit
LVIGLILRIKIVCYIIILGYKLFLLFVSGYRTKNCFNVLAVVCILRGCDRVCSSKRSWKLVFSLEFENVDNNFIYLSVCFHCLVLLLVVRTNSIIKCVTVFDTCRCLIIVLLTLNNIETTTQSMKHKAKKSNNLASETLFRGLSLNLRFFT